MVSWLETWFRVLWLSWRDKLPRLTTSVCEAIYFTNLTEPHWLCAWWTLIKSVCGHSLRSIKFVCFYSSHCCLCLPATDLSSWPWFSVGSAAGWQEMLFLYLPSVEKCHCNINKQGWNLDFRWGGGTDPSQPFFTSYLLSFLPQILFVSYNKSLSLHKSSFGNWCSYWTYKLALRFSLVYWLNRKITFDGQHYRFVGFFN